jgi:hypothetical protein
MRHNGLRFPRGGRPKQTDNLIAFKLFLFSHNHCLCTSIVNFYRFFGD